MNRDEALKQTKSSKFLQKEIYNQYLDDEEFVMENLKIIDRYFRDHLVIMGEIGSVDEHDELEKHLERDIEHSTDEFISITTPRIKALLKNVEHPIKFLEAYILSKELKAKKQQTRKAKI